MKRISTLTVTCAAAFLVVACGATPPAAGAPAGEAVAAAAPAASGGLNESYSDALPVATQLILGSLKLEEGAQPISADEAAKLLPLWQAYQNLSVSDSVAEAELTALVNQIQRGMQPGQVEAIAAMQLTADDITEVLQAQGPGLFGGGGGQRSANGADGAFPAPPGGGGFIPGRGPGGGQGGDFTQINPEERATAMAVRAAQGGGRRDDFMARGLVNALIMSLRLKTGDLTQEQLQAEQAQRTTQRWVRVAADATGIAADKLRAAVAEGKTLSEAIQTEGGDISKAEAAIREILKNAPNAGAQNIEAELSSALNAKAPAQPPSQ